MKFIYQLIIILLLTPYFVKAQTKIKLFNTKDLTGWYAFEPESGKHENASDLFSVDNKMIRLYGAKAGYLMSKQSFQNFKLIAEFRWNTDSTFTRKSNSKNSGLMYLVPSETLTPYGQKVYNFK